jgi:3-oxoacyl-[acyl-carrier-protein] synthase-3
MGFVILGTGSDLPEQIVSNEAYEAIVETSDEWIVKRTGIHERRIADEPTYRLAERAAKRALADAAVKPEEVDLILCTTVTNDFATPALACVIQGLIGAKNAIAFDINAACAAFVYALDLAQMYLQNGYQRILIVSAESLSKITDYTDRSTCVLFGDAAGACLIGPAEGKFSSALGCDGTGLNALFVRRSENEVPFVETTQRGALELPPAHDNLLYMDGREVYKFAVHAMSQAVRDASAKFGTTPEQLDLIIPHQANIRIIQTAAKELGLPMDRFFSNLERYGNTSSACIPVALDEARKAGRIKPGDTVCLVGFGAGLVYGGAVFTV